MNIKLKRIGMEDCKRLWKMQVEAFSELLEKYQDYDISPANELLSRIEERLRQPFTYYYFIMDGETAVGASAPRGGLSQRVLLNCQQVQAQCPLGK